MTGNLAAQPGEAATRRTGAGGPAASGTWLVVVDMQNVFGEEGSEWKAPRFEEIVGPVARLVEAYAPNVVFTRFVAPAAPAGAWVPYYRDWPFALQEPGHRMWEVVAPLSAAVPRVHGADGASGTVDKPTFSKWGPELAGLLGPEGRMVLTGVSTDCCVIATALAAADAGVEVLVVPEACAGVDDPSHQQALHVMSLFAPLIKVVPLAEALAAAPAPGPQALARQ